MEKLKIIEKLLKDKTLTFGQFKILVFLAMNPDRELSHKDIRYETATSLKFVHDNMKQLTDEGYLSYHVANKNKAVTHQKKFYSVNV